MRRYGGLLLMALSCLAGPVLAEEGSGAPAAEPAARPAPKPVSAMDLQEYRVAGNTVLPREAIERAVYPYLGPGRTMNDIEEARRALEQAYHDAGYMTVYVSVPPQKVVRGVITLKVNQGTVERVRVSGAEYTLPSRIKSEAPSIAEGAVPNFYDLQDQLNAINRAPGLRVTPSLEAGHMPGTTDIDLKVNDAFPLTGWLDYNNAHSANASPNVVAGGFSYANLFQRGHDFSLQFQTTPEHPAQSSAVSASYLMPVDHYSRYLSFYAVHSRSNLASTSVNLGDQVLFGNNDIVGGRYIIPMRALPGSSRQVLFGLDYKDSKQDASGINTPVRYWTLDGGYNYGRDDARGQWQFGASTVLGLRGPADRDTAFQARRAYARGDFAVLKLNGQRTQKLPADWSAMALIDMQLADQPLINNEQFSAGGVGSVRGYLQSEAAGDQGVRGTLELRAPVLKPARLPTLGLQPYLFFDAAYLQVHEPLAGQATSYGLKSVGVGLSMHAGRTFTLNLNVADPLQDGPKNDLSTSPARSFTEANNVRVHFDTRLDF